MLYNTNQYEQYGLAVVHTPAFQAAPSYATPLKVRCIYHALPVNTFFTAKENSRRVASSRRAVYPPLRRLDPPKRHDIPPRGLQRGIVTP